MNNKKKKLIEYFVISLAIIVIFVSFLTILYFHSFERDNFELGLNFSNKYAEYLGLDWQDSYLAILDELQVKYIRLAAPWNEIEPEKDFYAFAALDWQIEQADKRGVDIILAIGRRTPHWPECHDPEWIKGLADEVVVTIENNLPPQYWSISFMPSIFKSKICLYMFPMSLEKIR